MRKALIVGVDYYTSPLGCLYGCVNDALKVKNVLEQHSDQRANFGAKLVTATNEATAVTRAELKDHVRDLFAGDNEIELFYFAGHGSLDTTGGFLCGSDSQRSDDGLSLGEVLALANHSNARNKVVVLDSCYSGLAGTRPGQQIAEITDGMTILTASTKDQYAGEEQGGGVFTTLFVDALNGAAGNLVGDVTPGSVYAHIDQSLGPWAQRPVFKTNVTRFVSLRKVDPPIPLSDLKRLTEFFPTKGFQFNLDPSFEPEAAGRPEGAPPPNPENTAIFAILQRYNRVNLLTPAGAPHMWHAAIQSKSCKLTVLGEHYRQLIDNKRI